MSSRDYVKHVVSSNTAPNGARVGDEYFDPIANKLYKVVAISGSNVTSVEVVTNIGTGIRFGDNSIQTTSFTGSGYTANSIIIANTNGYLSSTTGLSYDPSSDVTSLTGAIKTGSIFINSNTITTNTTISTGYNGFAVGPITIANNISVTVANNSRWVII